MPIFITEDEATKLLSIDAAIPVIEESFRAAGERRAINPARTHLYTKKGYLKVGSGALLSSKVMGLKVVANAGASVPLNLVFDTETAELLAIVQSAYISKCRTCAVAAVAIKHLAAPGPVKLGIYGSGRLAEGHLEAASYVCDIQEARVYSRSPANREAFAEKMSARLGFRVIPVSQPKQAAETADIVMAITNTETPVVLGEWFNKPCLVIGAGANHWYERELDEILVERATTIIVDEKEQAKRECGDLLWAIDHGIKSWDDIEELGNIVAGRLAPPDPKTSLTIFESQGLGIHDVAIAAYAYERAKSQGMGQDLHMTGTPSVKRVQRL